MNDCNPHPNNGCRSVESFFKQRKKAMDDDAMILAHNVIHSRARYVAFGLAKH
jgi:hypothetical protein